MPPDLSLPRAARYSGVFCARSGLAEISFALAATSAGDDSSEGALEQASRSVVNHSTDFMYPKEDPIPWFSKNRRARLARSRPWTRRTTRGRPPAPPRIERMDIEPHGGGWALEVDELDEPAWVVTTRKKAVAAPGRVTELTV